MPTLFDTRRYLTNFDSTRTAHVLTDVLVIGSGVAGARAAIEAAKYGSVTLLTKTTFEESCTRYAQGGIAVALGLDDSPRAHYEDTIRVGCGLNRTEAVQRLVDDAPARIDELQRWGFALDQEDGAVALGREGGHSTNRIVHARGDQTGQELTRTLEGKVRATENIRVFEDCFLIDLITYEDRCVGAVTAHEKYGHQLVWARQTILASGGCGRLWRETTNPPVATGDGLAAAFRAGASLMDMEMVQFHPTTLYVAGAGRALISEAVRGEGAYLVDKAGERFMPRFHPDGELAPRDVVSRAIHQHLRDTRANCVYLDVRHLGAFAGRFPQIAALCAEFDIDVTRDRIPVRPSAHYLIGGVAVDLEGRASIRGLLACGETACTGVHGANRIASNSLLEGLVFGRVTGEAAGMASSSMASNGGRGPVGRFASHTPPSRRTTLDLPDIRNSLRSVMWRNVGIVRRGELLAETCEILDFWAHYTLDKTLDEAFGWETQNQLTVARLVAASGLCRTESIGVHFREDGAAAPERPYHVAIRRDAGGTDAMRLPA